MLDAPFRAVVGKVMTNCFQLNWMQRAWIRNGQSESTDPHQQHHHRHRFLWNWPGTRFALAVVLTASHQVGWFLIRARKCKLHLWTDDVWLVKWICLVYLFIMMIKGCNLSAAQIIRTQCDKLILNARSNNINNRHLPVQSLDFSECGMKPRRWNGAITSHSFVKLD